MRKRLLALLVVLVAVLVGCSAPETQLPQATATRPAGPSSSAKAATGTVTFTVPHFAPWTQQAAKKGANNRAFMEADMATFSLLDAGNNVLNTWTDNLSSSQQSTSTADTNTQDLLPGSYSVNVDVYNINNSSTVPTVSGTAAFSVSAGSSTPVTVTCLPNIYVTLNAVSYSLQNAPQTFNGSDEYWYSIPSIPKGDNLSLKASSAGGTGNVYFYVFNPDGTYTGFWGSAANGTTGAIVPFIDAGTGYYVVFWADGPCTGALYYWSTSLG